MVVIGQREAKESLKGKKHFHSWQVTWPLLATVCGQVMNTNSTVHVSLHYVLLKAIKVSLCHGNVLSTKIITLGIVEVMCFLLMTTETGH